MIIVAHAQPCWLCSRTRADDDAGLHFVIAGLQSSQANLPARRILGRRQRHVHSGRHRQYSRKGEAERFAGDGRPLCRAGDVVRGSVRPAIGREALWRMVRSKKILQIMVARGLVDPGETDMPEQSATSSKSAAPDQDEKLAILQKAILAFKRSTFVSPAAFRERLGPTADRFFSDMAKTA